MKKLPLTFYRRGDVLQISRELLGKIVQTNFEGIITSGRIVELEAYAGPVDKASHAYGNRRTARTETMYANGGVAYVYLCYGIHQMLNIVTHDADIPHAILVRALEPIRGIDDMLVRTGKKKLDATLTRGPGNVGKALGIHTSHTGLSLTSPGLSIFDDGFAYNDNEIGRSARIGVDYAGDHAEWLYRFYVKGNPYVSAKPR